jgi:hypothetical protein
MALFQQSSKTGRKAFPKIKSKRHNTLTVLFTITPMKSIILTSLLAVVSCVALSVVVALVAAPSNLQNDEFKVSSPPAAPSVHSTTG